MIIKEFDAQSDFVHMYKPGDGFELWYKVGGGGGHEIYITRPNIEFTFEQDKGGNFAQGVNCQSNVECKKEVKCNDSNEQRKGNTQCKNINSRS